MHLSNSLLIYDATNIFYLKHHELASLVFQRYSDSARFSVFGNKSYLTPPTDRLNGVTGTSLKHEFRPIWDSLT